MGVDCVLVDGKNFIECDRWSTFSSTITQCETKNKIEMLKLLTDLKSKIGEKPKNYFVLEAIKFCTNSNSNEFKFVPETELF